MKTQNKEYDILTTQKLRWTLIKEFVFAYSFPSTDTWSQYSVQWSIKPLTEWRGHARLWVDFQVMEESKPDLESQSFNSHMTLGKYFNYSD